MSRNGSGTYNLPAGNPVVTGTTIDSSWANSTLNNIADALTGSIASDGQTPMTGALNMTGHLINNVTDPTSAQDAATKAYVDAKTDGTGAGSFTNLAYTGTLTGGTGVVNLGSGQFYKDASGSVGIGTSSPTQTLDVNGIIKTSTGLKVGSEDNFLYQSSVGTVTFAIEDGASTQYLGLVNETDGPMVDAAGGQLLLGTGGTERMRIDSSGNVGIGAASTGAQLYQYLASGTTQRALQNGSVISLDYASTTLGNVTYGSQSNHPVVLTTNNTERMRIDSSGNVGIGNTDPSYSLSGGLYNGLVMQSATVSTQLRLYTSGSSGLADINGATISVYDKELFVSNKENADTIFETNSTERMRIDSSGRIQMNTTAPKYNALLTLVKGSNSYTLTSSVSGTASSGHMVFENNNADAVGTIFTSGSSTSYNTSSDYRLKENIAPMTGALGVIQQLKPVTYTWKSTGENGQGFIAHELQAVVPDCVTGEKDAVDEEGKPVYQGIDTSFLVATLTAAIQELNAKLDAQTQKIIGLEEQVINLSVK